MECDVIASPKGEAIFLVCLRRPEVASSASPPRNDVRVLQQTLAVCLFGDQVRVRDAKDFEFFDDEVVLHNSLDWPNSYSIQCLTAALVFEDERCTDTT